MKISLVSSEIFIYKNIFMIRLGIFKDLPAVAEVYRAARKYMAENGNPTQWGEGYPSEELTRSDIRNGNLYVI